MKNDSGYTPLHGASYYGKLEIVNALLAVPGASAYFLGGGVIYTRPARDHLLGVDFREFAGRKDGGATFRIGDISKGLAKGAKRGVGSIMRSLKDL